MAIAKGAPVTETTIAQLIWQHTGFTAFNPRTWYKWMSRHRGFAYSFIEVHSLEDGESLVHSITNIVTDGVAWEAEWCHDSFASLMANTYTLYHARIP